MNRAVVFLDELLADPKAKARTDCALCGEERLKICFMAAESIPLPLSATVIRIQR